MATTVGDLLKTSLRKIGVLDSGEPMSPDEGSDALDIFRQMVDAWSLETLLIPIVGVVTFTLINNQSEYTIGIYPGGSPPDNHIETPRPMKILAAFIRDQYETDYIQEIIDVDTFSRISRKTNASRPSRFYVREGWPLNTILFEAVPYADETLHMSVIQPLDAILPTAKLTDVVNLPPGYERTLIFNLCPELADEWGKKVSNNIAVQAVTGKKWIKRNNARAIVLGMDHALATQRKGIGTYIIEQGP